MYYIVWLCLCVVVFWCFLCVCVFVFFGVCAFVFLRVCVLCLGFLFVVKAVWCNCVCVSPNRFSHRGSYFKLGGEGSQILWIRCRGAVTQGVVGGAVWCVCVCVGVRVRRSKTGLSHRVSLEVSSGVWRGPGSQIQHRAVTQGVVGGAV